MEAISTQEQFPIIKFESFSDSSAQINASAPAAALSDGVDSVAAVATVAPALRSALSDVDIPDSSTIIDHVVTTVGADNGGSSSSANGGSDGSGIFDDDTGSAEAGGQATSDSPTATLNSTNDVRNNDDNNNKSDIEDDEFGIKGMIAALKIEKRPTLSQRGVDTEASPRKVSAKSRTSKIANLLNGGGPSPSRNTTITTIQRGSSNTRLNGGGPSPTRNPTIATIQRGSSNNQIGTLQRNRSSLMKKK